MSFENFSFSLMGDGSGGSGRYKILYVQDGAADRDRFQTSDGMWFAVKRG